MVNIKEACRIAQESRPKCRLYSCIETNEYYFFYLPSRRWNGIGGGPAGGSIDYVKKEDGSFGSMDFIDALTKMLEEDDGIDIDVKPYVSKEDAEFIDFARIHSLDYV